MTPVDSQQLPVSKWKRLCPQIWASIACNTLLFNLSVAIFYITILNGELRLNATDLHNVTATDLRNVTDAPLALDDFKATSLGSAQLIFQPVGSLFSGFLTQRFGRKRVLLFLNLPFLLGWIMFSFADSYGVLLSATIIHGVAMGLIEAPLCTYVGETCEPHLRGVLATATGVYYQLGVLFIFLLAQVLHWRTIAYVCCALPIASAVGLRMVPESPDWLFSKHRDAEAEESFCRLRGCKNNPSAVQMELQRLRQHHQLKVNGGIDNPCFVDDNNVVSAQVVEEPGGGIRGGRIRGIVKEFWAPATRRPLLLIAIFMVLVTWSGFVSMRSYLLNIFHELNMPGESTVIQAAVGLCGAIFNMASVRRFGKRNLALWLTLVTVVCTALLGVYSYMELTPGHEPRAPWIAVVLFSAMSFLNNSLGTIPWCIMCEVFPFKTRSVASGVCSALYYGSSAGATYSFLGMKSALGLHGSLWFFSGVSAAGLVYLYFQMPETEGRSLEEIERHFEQGNHDNYTLKCF